MSREIQVKIIDNEGKEHIFYTPSFQAAIRELIAQEELEEPRDNWDERYIKMWQKSN